MDWRRQRIKAARELRGVSQEQLVEKCSWAISKHRQIESGAKSPTPGELYEIAQALDIDVAYFLYEEAEPFPAVVTMQGEAQVVHTEQAEAEGGQGQALPAKVPKAPPKGTQKSSAKDRQQAGS